MVPSLDRLSRSLAGLIGIVATLRRRGVGFKSLHEALDATTPGGRLVFHVFAALAEFIRELIVKGTREGLDAHHSQRMRPAPAGCRGTASQVAEGGRPGEVVWLRPHPATGRPGIDRSPIPQRPADGSRLRPARPGRISALLQATPAIDGK